MCSIPKLTKLNYDSNNKSVSNNTNNEINNQNNENTNNNNNNTLRKLQYNSQTSKIPNCSTVKKSDNNSNVKTTLIATPTSTTTPQATITKTPSQMSNTVSNDNSKKSATNDKMSKSMNSNLPTLNSPNGSSTPNATTNLVYNKLPNKMKSLNTNPTSNSISVSIVTTNTSQSTNNHSPAKKQIPSVPATLTTSNVNSKTDTTTMKTQQNTIQIEAPTKSSPGTPTNIARVTPFKAEVETNKVNSASSQTPLKTEVITQSNTEQDSIDCKLTSYENEDYLIINEQNSNELKPTLSMGLNVTTSTTPPPIFPPPPVLDINDTHDLDSNHNGYPSDKDLSTYARKIQKRFKDGIQAVKESMQLALSDEDMSDISFKDETYR